MPKGSRVTVRCEAMVHGGLCLAHTGGQTLMVGGAIPGELVEASVSFRKGRTVFCTVARVLEASPQRVAPPCPYVPDCGGCQLQHVAYPAQLALKRDIVLDALQRERVPVPALRVLGMDDPWNYRWRGEFHVIPGAHGVQDANLGFNRARSWTPIAVDDCLIHHRSISSALPLLREAVRRGGSPALTALHVTAGEGGEELMLRARPRPALDPVAIDDIAGGLPHPQRWSRDWTTLHWRGHAFRVSPESFIQVNWTHIDVLYGCILEALGEVTGQRIVDGYAGIGVLSVAIAESAREVVCIESNREAARMGRLNAQINGVDGRMRYLAAPVETALPEVRAEGAINQLILDPPRAGCGGQVTGWLALAGPDRIVYVSCDPATLARDLHVLVTSGPYRVTAFDLVDMFPQTYHVESVVALSRAA